MSTITYLDGSQLTSTALTEVQIQTALQIAAAQALGIVMFAVEMALTENSQIATPTGLGNLAIGQVLYSPSIPLPTAANPVQTTITGIDIDSGTITMSAASLATTTDSVIVGPSSAFSRVRVDWQLQGQPGWSPGDPDTCIIGCLTVPSEYSNMRDVTNTSDATTITQTDVYTRCWRTSWTFYGPNCIDNARAVRSALIKLAWISELLAQSNLFIQSNITEPLRVPENFQGQWWPRVDMTSDFNEQITETYTVGTVQSVQVSLYTGAGQFSEFTAQA